MVRSESLESVYLSQVDEYLRNQSDKMIASYSSNTMQNICDLSYLEHNQIDVADKKLSRMAETLYLN